MTISRRATYLLSCSVRLIYESLLAFSLVVVVVVVVEESSCCLYSRTPCTAEQRQHCYRVTDRQPLGRRLRRGCQIGPDFKIERFKMLYLSQGELLCNSRNTMTVK